MPDQEDLAHDARHIDPGPAYNPPSAGFDSLGPKDIGWAVKQMRNGARVGRSGWNGKNMWLELQVPDAHSKMTLPYVYMRTAQGDLVPWLCSQTDLLAIDWSGKSFASLN
jgi:hypothetical protein